jgi:hypothetical protein
MSIAILPMANKELIKRIAIKSASIILLYFKKPGHCTPASFINQNIKL